MNVIRSILNEAAQPSPFWRELSARLDAKLRERGISENEWPRYQEGTKRFSMPGFDPDVEPPSAGPTR